MTGSGGWERLLHALDPHPAAAGRAYEALRERLRQRFLWRGAADPDGLVDVTFDRVVQKLAEGEQVDNVSSFALGVSRFVLMEAARRDARSATAEARMKATPVAPSDEAMIKEQRAAALDGCLGELSDTQRDLVLTYHRGRGQERIDRRRRLAEGLEIGLNALRIRAHRLRARLEACVKKTLAGRNVSRAGATQGEGGLS